jgi:outer membrane protein assembly factor BamD (BamD/ComL family)
MGWTRLLIIIGCLLCASSARAEPKAWEPGDKGGWKAVPTTQPATPAGPIIDPVLDRVQLLLRAGDYDRAHDVGLDWVKQNPHAPDRDRGLFLLAEAYYGQGDMFQCFYECDELLDNLPESKLFFPALEVQYRVADDCLRGFKSKFLGLRIVPMDDTGIEILYRIQERAPGAPIAERALRRTADFYYHTSQFDLAADAYGAFIRIYPRSPEVARARLRQAYSNFAQFRGPRYDITPLLDARAQFMEIITFTPDLAQQEGVQQFVDRIDENLAAKIASDADYYVRVNNLKAAVFLYRALIQQYPNSRDAAAAKKILATMPASALATPPPPASEGLAPVTRPSMGP